MTKNHVRDVSHPAEKYSGGVGYVRFYGMNRRLRVVLIAGALTITTSAWAGFLSVTPPTVEVSAQPGTVVRGKFTVTNMEEFSAPLQVEVEMVGGNSEGQDQFSPRANWVQVKVSPRLVLHPRVPRVVRYRIDVPENIVGEEMARVFFSLNPSSDAGAGLGMLMRVGVPIYLIGKGTETGEIFPRDFSVVLEQANTLTFNVVLKFVGNVHIRPRGEWTISDDDGLTVERVPLSYGTVLFPGNEKGFEAKTERSWFPGTYRVRLTVTHGETWGEHGVPLKTTKDFQLLIANGTAQLSEVSPVP